MATLQDPDRLFQVGASTFELRGSVYHVDAPAQLPDDGIVDPIAVERFAYGDTSVRVTGREMVAAVLTLAALGYTDGAIAHRIGIGDGSPKCRGARRVEAIRRRHRFPAGAELDEAA